MGTRYDLQYLQSCTVVKSTKRLLLYLIVYLIWPGLVEFPESISTFITGTETKWLVQVFEATNFTKSGA